jgi:hypothetical protein
MSALSFKGCLLHFASLHSHVLVNNFRFHVNKGPLALAPAQFDGPSPSRTAATAAAAAAAAAKVKANATNAAAAATAATSTTAAIAAFGATTVTKHELNLPPKIWKHALRAAQRYQVR